MTRLREIDVCLSPFRARWTAGRRSSAMRAPPPSSRATSPTSSAPSAVPSSSSCTTRSSRSSTRTRSSTVRQGPAEDEFTRAQLKRPVTFSEVHSEGKWIWSLLRCCSSEESRSKDYSRRHQCVKESTNQTDGSSHKPTTKQDFFHQKCNYFSSPHFERSKSGAVRCLLSWYSCIFHKLKSLSAPNQNPQVSAFITGAQLWSSTLDTSCVDFLYLNPLYLSCRNWHLWNKTRKQECAVNLIKSTAFLIFFSSCFARGNTALHSTQNTVRGDTRVGNETLGRERCSVLSFKHLVLSTRMNLT